MWPTIDRNVPVVDPQAPPLLSEAVQGKIRSFFPRYETKRAVLLPALHIVQNTLGHISWQAMVEIAKLLEIQPSEVFDTVSFYTHFWTYPKGEKVITACRSISCELMGGTGVLDELKRVLGVEEHGTTSDGRYSLVTEECLAGCDHAPCLLINEKLHKRVKAENVETILADPENDRLPIPRSDLFDAPIASRGLEPARPNGNAMPKVPGNATGNVEFDGAIEEILERTSDVREMRESE